MADADYKYLKDLVLKVFSDHIFIFIELCFSRSFNFTFVPILDYLSGRDEPYEEIHQYRGHERP